MCCQLRATMVDASIPSPEVHLLEVLDTNLAAGEHALTFRM